MLLLENIIIVTSKRKQRLQIRIKRRFLLLIKATIVTAIIATSYTASAKDGAFNGNVNFNNHTKNTVTANLYSVNGAAEKSHSGFVVTNKKRHMSFNEKLLSTADK